MPDQFDLLMARTLGFNRTLRAMPNSAKSSRVSLALANEFNRLVGDVARAFPDVSSSLPREIETTGPFSGQGQVALNYIDIEVLAQQLGSILTQLHTARNQVGW